MKKRKKKRWRKGERERHGKGEREKKEKIKRQRKHANNSNECPRRPVPVFREN